MRGKLLVWLLVGWAVWALAGCVAPEPPACDLDEAQTAARLPHGGVARSVKLLFEKAVGKAR